jgi:CO/xanthine dehydrogenase FAD-binding subunit
MNPGEIMTSIFVPFPSPGSGTSYKHISARGKVDISAVCVGVVVNMEGNKCKDVKIVLGAVGPTPMRAVKAEAVLKGKKWTESAVKEAGERASTEAKPISDVRSSAEYRKKMVSVLVRRALREAHERAMKN